MLSKLEVGMYVRTNLGEIAKLIESRHFENETGNYNYLVTDKEIKKAIYDDQKNEHIIKASHNIIDLIEVGDVIKYEIKTSLETSGVLKGITNISDKDMLENIKNDINYVIKSVVTKEQFESMKYEANND